jgi:hypothetical protein
MSPLRPIRSFHLAGPALAAALLALAGAPAEAQFRVVPQVGMYAGASELPPLDGVAEFGRREASLAYGAALEFGPGLRLAVLHGTDGEIPIDGIGCTDCARSTVTAATAALVVRPLPTLGFVRPFLLIGGGVKRYDFTREDVQNEGVRAILDDRNDATGHLGLGFEFDLGPLGALVEIQDLVSNFEAPGVESRFQHDLFLTVGLALGW